MGAYNPIIDDNATAVVCARTKAACKENLADRATYETARRERAQFIISVAKDNWVRELQNTETIYTGVSPKALIAHLQAGCTGSHALNLLDLHNEMQCYHLGVEGIPEYINMLEDAQKQAGRAGCTIADETLLLFATTSMLTTEIFPRTNDDWEDRAEANTIWAEWKTEYKRAHAKARVEVQATEGSDKFGAANTSTRVHNTSEAETNNSPLTQ